MRRIRADLIETFRLIKGFDDIDYRKLFHVSTFQSTRGHKYKFYKPRPKLQLRKYSYSNRVVNAWNSLPNEAVAVDTINQFKKFMTSSQLIKLMGN